MCFEMSTTFNTVLSGSELRIYLLMITANRYKSFQSFNKPRLPIFNNCGTHFSVGKINYWMSNFGDGQVKFTG